MTTVVAVLFRRVRVGLSEFCAKKLKILHIIFVNSAQLLLTFSSKFFHFKIISHNAVLPSLPH